ncbi:MAG: cytochrome c3 family protein, partial [Xanthomonadales bacterium]|nr:cytochrome c3 family protein [Xanthomonadales bacterium]
PLRHTFTRAIPTSQCMICHMHQPNMFLNTYLGYTMWDYESDAPFMWPEEQRYPDSEEQMAILNRNPEEAATRGRWAEEAFLREVSGLNPRLKDTQFADYHGHGWNFRAIFKRDRDGTLLDEAGGEVSDEDAEKFSKAVHMSSTHLDAGMHCADCHFSQDSHGTGHIQGEVMAAVEIRCVDCHGSAKSLPSLVTSGPAAPPKGNDLSVLRNPDGQKRFEWMGDKLIQRSVVTPGLEWEVSLVRDSVTPGHPQYNERSARAKLMESSPDQNWGPDISAEDLAHKDDELACYSCHTSWTTSCGGCHLPIQANRMADTKHFEGGISRNFASYNPQVARDQMFQLGRHGDIKNGIIAPVRSSSALVLSSQNANRERIYIQQPPIAASGFSSQAFAPHFPHTVRKTETKTCNDCHLSAEKDNNAIMAQLLLLGTNFVNFVGAHVWAGGEGQIEGIRVTEFDEPQAVIGSYLHRYAYPDWFAQHEDNGRVLQEAYDHRSGSVGCLQARGEYLYVAEGTRGMQVYDVANIANKGFSQRIITAPFSPLGHDTRVRSAKATCVALPTNQPIHPARNRGELMREVNREQPFHPIYNYALITDAEEGLILTDVNTLSDGKFRNNFLERALTWDGDGALEGARYLKVAGHYVYVATPREIVVVDLDQPL